MNSDQPLFHTLDINETLKVLKTSQEKGLSESQVLERGEHFGPNALEATDNKKLSLIILEQILDFMVLILLGAAVVSLILGEAADAFVILFIVVLNTMIGAFQEYKAQKAVEALKKISIPSLLVIRDDHLQSVSHDKLVPGDIVTLETGNIIPADLRILKSIGLQIDESSLTGESLPVEKVTDKLKKANLVLGDRINMVYKGSVVTMGHGLAVVVSTGMKTEIGKMASLIHGAPVNKTPLQIRLAKFGKKLTITLLMICVGIFALGFFTGKPWFEMFMTAVSLAVAAIPEALPAVVTISLALGAKRMVKNKALIRNLPGVETLGSVTYICSDKTGTLTQNKMHVECVWPEDKALDETLLHAMALCNDATHDGDKIFGEPTEAALYHYAMTHGKIRKHVEDELPRVDEIPFSSNRKMMTTVHENNRKLVAYTKGAPEKVALLCEPEKVEAILAKSEELAGKGIRVLALATREVEEGMTKNEIETEFRFLALVGLMDPPREEVYQSIKDCKNAGIIPVMITGDHLATAKTIATKLGILSKDASKEEFLTGEELNALSDEKFEANVENVKLYARTSPEQKIKIVDALQDKGHFVAMTGDGVNDAPALKKADIGVAMGIVGSDVSKESSDLILLDDNFSTIVHAIGEGRTIYDNIQKFIKFVLMGNTGEILTILVAPFVGIPIPLLPIHILWVNVLTDGLPGIALTLEPAEGDILKRPPRHPKEPLFSKLAVIRILLGGFMVGLSTLGVAIYAYHEGMHFQTMAFTALVFSQFLMCWSVRKNTASFFQTNLFSNGPLLLVLLGSIALHLVMIYTPPLAAVFRLDPLSQRELLICCIPLLFLLPFSELEKWWFRKNT